MVYIVSREVGTFHHGQTLLLSESGTPVGVGEGIAGCMSSRSGTRAGALSVEEDDIGVATAGVRNFSRLS